jgi:hypothetical protein
VGSVAVGSVAAVVGSVDVVDAVTDRDLRMTQE